MCGRYTNTAGVEELNDRFNVPITSETGTRRYNVAPTEEVLAIVAPRGEPRQPFLFRVDGGMPFAFAALWTPAKIGGRWISSVSLLTCDAAPNPIAAAIHDRMPVILADRDVQRAWLDPGLGAEEALQLCGPLAEARLSARPANPARNKPDPDLEGPELLRPPE